MAFRDEVPDQVGAAIDDTLKQCVRFHFRLSALSAVAKGQAMTAKQT